MVLAGRDFINFLDYVYIMEPPPGRGKIKLEKWPHVLEMAHSLLNERQLAILKARQIGFSWILAAYDVWLLRFHEGAVLLNLSKGQNEATALLGKVRFIYKALPEAWQLPLGTDSRSEISIPGMSSKIMALPATEDAGRSETATLVAQDEGDFHEFLDANLAAVKPTIDAGGQIVMGSTSNKKKMISLFKELYRGAPNNGWKALFYPWHVRPGRDQAWYERTKDSIPETSDMSPDLYMEQEYPASSTEALAPARSLQAFDMDILKDMEEDCRRPVETLGPINIYQKWRMGRKYMAGTDVSHGVGRDYSVTTIIDAQTGYVVADIMDNMVGPEELAEASVRLLTDPEWGYRSPIWGIEDNEWGIIVIKAAEAVHYPRIFHRETGRGSKKIGWHTDGSSRFVLWGELIQAVASRHLIVPNKAGLDQFSTVIRNTDARGTIEAMVGAHDDYPMAVGIAWQMRKWAYSGGMVDDVIISYGW